MDIENIDTDELVSDYKNLVFHMINRIVSDTSYHEDLFQEVFVNILEGLRRFEGRSKLSTWISSVAIHTCFKFMRSRIKEGRNMSWEEFLEKGGEPLVARSQNGNAKQREDAKGIISDTLNRLPLKYKLPIALYYYEGHSYREIADIMDMPIGTVKTNMFRGLKSMRKELGDDIHEIL